MNYPSLQEAFNMWANMPADLRALLYETEQLDRKHMETIKKQGLTDQVLDDQEALAHKWGLEYVHPKYARGLKPVGPANSPSVH